MESPKTPPKKRNYTFRLTPEMKVEMLQRSLELHLQPAEYIVSLIEKDLLAKTHELPVREKTFIEQQFSAFSAQLLSFMVDNFDRKLISIEEKVSLNNTVQYKVDSLNNYIKRNGLKASQEYLQKLHQRIADVIDKEVNDIVKEINVKIQQKERQS